MDREIRRIAGGLNALDGADAFEFAFERRGFVIVFMFSGSNNSGVVLRCEIQNLINVPQTVSKGAAQVDRDASFDIRAGKQVLPGNFPIPAENDPVHLSDHFIISPHCGSAHTRGEFLGILVICIPDMSDIHIEKRGAKITAVAVRGFVRGDNVRPAVAREGICADAVRADTETPGSGGQGPVNVVNTTGKIDVGSANVIGGTGIELNGEFPVAVPYFMREIVEQISVVARRSKYVDQQSGVSARLSIANYRTMIASARQRAALLGERPAVPRVSDLGHLYSSSLGKLELDLMGSHQMSERQVLDAILAEAVRDVFQEYVDRHGLEEIAEVFSRGVKIEVGDLLPSSEYARRLQRVPPAWDKAFEVNASGDPAVRASCVEFVLAGLYATEKISRSQHHGRIVYEIP